MGEHRRQQEDPERYESAGDPGGCVGQLVPEGDHPVPIVDNHAGCECRLGRFQMRVEWIGECIAGRCASIRAL